MDDLFAGLAEKSLRDEALTRAEAHAVLSTPAEALRDLLWAAFRVRERCWGRWVKICMLENAQSGLCSEDCHYCSQSALSTADIDVYGLRPAEILVGKALAAAARGAERFCIAASGRDPGPEDIATLATAAREIRQRAPGLELCASVGILSEEQGRTLQQAGIGWINHNLNTSERYYPAICTTHTYEDRVETLLNARRAGLRLCSGGIIGMGETAEDVIALAYALRDLAVDSLPINFLHPIDGTPLCAMDPLEPAQALRALCLFRFLNPRCDVRVAGGREHILGSWQGLALYPATSIFVGGYLTTPGQDVEEARRMIEALGFQATSVHCGSAPA